VSAVSQGQLIFYFTIRSHHNVWNMGKEQSHSSPDGRNWTLMKSNEKEKTRTRNPKKKSENSWQSND